MLCSANDQPVTSVNNMKIFDDVKLNKSYDEWLELNVELLLLSTWLPHRLLGLGETQVMDISIEGSHRWIFHGLSFLVPFLLVGYLFQLYNAYSLRQLAHAPTTHDWQ
ncbi:unnamed protein product, partial [Rotaria magnacalcarata]